MRNQHGLISRRQALAAGVTEGQLRQRLRRGRWVPAAHGVYRHASMPPTPASKLLAACLAHDALASHRSAAALHGVDGYTLNRIELVVPAGRARAIAGAALHESAHLDLAKPVVRQGIPCTGLPRTMLDLAAVVNREQLDQAIDAVLRDRLLRLRDLYSVLASHRRRGRDGSAALGAALDERFGENPVPLSAWSRMVADLLVNSGLAPPALEHRVFDANGAFVAQVDLAYPRLRLAIELDSFRWHHNHVSFVADRQRRNKLMLAGWQVLNFTWVDYEKRPGGLCAEVAAACEAAGPKSL